MTKFVYDFNEGNGSMKDLLGGKGANLAEMTSLGLPVPRGFTISTEACIEYLNSNRQLSKDLELEIFKHLKQLENKTNKSFNSSSNLLLVSVRSGARSSMPGMMDTILNLGLNDKNVEVLAKATKNSAFAYDCYRRLLQMYGDVVYGIDSHYFENYLTHYKSKNNLIYDQDLTTDDLKEIVKAFKGIYKKVLNKEFPQNPNIQLLEAVKAVFSSWNNERARVYRSLNDIPSDWGTAVTVQEMVFGNTGNESGTGVLFTRNPTTGEKEIFGEYLMNAQGEDVVAGIRTPVPISELQIDNPNIYLQIERICEQLEKHYEDMQDIEFTIENNQLFILQTRDGKRTAKSAFKIAVDLVEEGYTTKEKMISKINPQSIDQLLHPVFKPTALDEATVISAVGLPASPGAATGKVYFDAETAVEKSLAGQKVILVRHETSPEDISGMNVSEAIVTSRGGMTSHAAVVARGMGKCCVVGCEELEINEKKRQIKYNGGILNEGEVISVDGTTGIIYLGAVDKKATETDQSFYTVMEWAREIADLKVRMNAETIEDIKAGLEFQAAGIGLARTEHMFFSKERLQEMRKFILSARKTERLKALENIMTYQITDFTKIFEQTKDLPITIRLLDPPLHEFLPHSEQEIEEVAKQQGLTNTQLKQRISELNEVNPMLGHRGCRLAISYPELYLMQVEAIMRSAAKLNKKGISVKPEIMIPLVGMVEELEQLTKKIKIHIEKLLEELNTNVEYEIGTMVELPRACLVADELAETADFFSFGTNDLTQMTYGFSRDDAGKFINQYKSDQILEDDPFQTVDKDGVGRLIETAVKLGRSTKEQMDIGVCGELGGDPKSIEFFHEVGLDYVSCSPFRVPIAQLAAAQSTIKYDTIKGEVFS
ncbi:MAG TPA: pyruvate, phosphate dikinase [Candidatus Atopostipes pullistercoris]|uniref:Pyruvate, phosphate dikinase n=1 Tax=Candidatus Atopostipes pullistercoris TaxID=2838467 RepID=A0A9D2G0K6_9LACT|nr:pyruvate, phosphate dikinase [Candidatus Atopostipes pullistercoris]